VRVSQAYRGGQQHAAQDLAVAAYLDGFELVKRALDVVDKRSQNGGRGGE